MMVELHNKVVIVTGASAGIGAACAQKFVAQGARVVLLARGQAKLEAFAQALRTNAPTAQVLTYAFDVNDLNAFADMLNDVRAQWGRVDVLVNNAGAHVRGPFMTIAAAEVAQMVQTNLTTPLLICRMVLEIMTKQNAGTIINVASLAGRTPVDGAATYSATKFGLRAFSYALAEELREAQSGVRCCLVSPGPVNTGFVMDDIDIVADLTFSQKLCSAEHVADLIVQTVHDGRAERTTGGALAPIMSHLAYVFPKLKQRIKPMMKAKGARVKAQLKQEMQQK